MVLQATDSEPTQPVSHWFMFVYAMFGPAREQVPARKQPSVVPAE